MSVVQMAKMASKNADLEQKLKEANEKLASYELRDQAESFLTDLMQNPRAPLEMKPVDVRDFLDKRAQIERTGDIKLAQLATKMAGAGSFEIGDVDDDGRPSFKPSGSKADDMFQGWLLERGAEVPDLA